MRYMYFAQCGGSSGGKNFRALEKAAVYRSEEDVDDRYMITASGKFTEHKLKLQLSYAQSMKLPYRHAIAYRKAKKCSGNLIPLTSIDSRCMDKLFRRSQEVKQFSYESFGAGVNRDPRPGLVAASMLLAKKDCLNTLPVGNAQETAISVDASQGQTARDNKENPKTVGVVQIKYAKNFSRFQIELFKQVENLKSCGWLGINMHKGYPSIVPRKQIQGPSREDDFGFAMLYRATSTWLTDALIRALYLCLVADYSACRFAGFQSATSKTKRTRKNDDAVLDQVICDRLIAQTAEPGTDTVMLLLIFINAHCRKGWCKTHLLLRPPEPSPYQNAAQAVDIHLKIAGLNDYDAIFMNFPIEYDMHSCGVYMYWMFIRQVVPRSALLDKSAGEYYILTGRLLPVKGTHDAESDGTEEKMPAPVGVGGRKNPGEEDEGEDVPPTQVGE
ncbi:hypothetical protein P3T76_016040 [Phytophthora citrophthora]|uniref:Ubiquitin-like protease family profile domain-containing protein n=1 Tax=Phytophthora citrophthora TaxID=4793 RepID=A0AAD9L9Q8_9STRA|nr:hypothetical protein P3T76_016040 [Phytophthora citrophthora]